MKLTLSIQAGLLITIGAGLGYAMAMRDADEITDRLDTLQDTVDEVLRTVKYGDAVDVKAIEQPITDVDAEEESK